MVGCDPFVQKSILGRDPPKGYPPHAMWVQDVTCDNDVVKDIPMDTWQDHLEDENPGFGKEHPPPLDSG